MSYQQSYMVRDSQPQVQAIKDLMEKGSFIIGGITEDQIDSTRGAIRQAGDELKLEHTLNILPSHQGVYKLWFEEDKELGCGLYKATVTVQ